MKVSVRLRTQPNGRASWEMIHEGGVSNAIVCCSENFLAVVEIYEAGDIRG